MASVQYDSLLEEEVLHNHLAGDITDLTATLDPRYVNVTGDTMTGALTITPSANGTSILNVTNQAGTSVLNVDTTNRRVGFGTITPSSRLHVYGNTSSDYGQFDAGINLDQVDNPNTTGFSATVLNQAGNINAGVHYYAYTLITPIGETRITSPVGPYSFDAANAQATVTIPVSSDPRVTGRKIYRTKAGESQYTLYLLATINDNTTTTYSDNTADSGLGTVSMWYRPNTTNAGVLVNGVKTQLTDQMSTFYGYSAGGNSGNLGGYFNDCFGASAGTSLTTGGANALFGSSAGQNLTIYNGNSIFGSYAGYNVTSGYNTLMGYHALWGINGAVTGVYNTIIGADAGYNLKGSVSSNVIIGYQAGFGANTGTVNGNIFIGFQAGKTLATSNPSNKLNIHNADSLTPLIDGLFSGTGAGITINSQNINGVPLTVKGIASQASNLQEWQNSSGTGLVAVTATGNVGIGTTAPGAKLQVNGSASAITSIFRANATTPGNITEWQNSSGTALAYLKIPTGASPIEMYLNPTIADPTANDGVLKVSPTFTHSANRSYIAPAMAFNTISNTGGYTVSYAIGASGTAQATGTGGVISNLWGVNSQPVTSGSFTGTVTSSVAFNAAGVSVPSGTVSNHYGFFYNSASVTGGGVLTKEYGLYLQNVNSASAGNNYAILTNAGNIVFNEGGDASTDFRVESDTEANMLYLDANGDTDGALYLGGTTNGIKINKGGVLTFLGTANISGGASGSFTTADAKTVTVTNGIVTSIV